MLRWTSIYFLSLIITGPALAQSGDCPTIILDQNQGTAANIPVWNQKTKPICYSMTASMLASVWVREEWSKTQTTLSTYIDDPKNSFKSMQRSPEFSKILDADLGRTCQATAFILKQKKKTLAQFNPEFFSIPRCEMYGMIKDPNTKENVLRDPHEFEVKMHQLLQLGSRPKPFAIEYCSGNFLEGNETRELISNRRFKPNLSYLNNPADPVSGVAPDNDNFNDDCGFHAAIVTGQAIRDGQCQFRIRNSGGTKPKKLPNKQIDPDFQDGYYWIKASDLSRNTLRVISLEHE